ncbi:S-adenosyl-L-methionine-dependent methyltransferase [Podospora aff. communis PSN243]|uniref:S-adenosyl-L-methionine-dependent methyltransferase n=1 Tax=Podospora aff. communis PSN243 TaxID=3040156 RepID=A0AAV9GH58_9PEZI|nr:S-adenosyl-L-methionine-dependent methyltransferase [Podospora aff. communis PSN243]
MPTPTQYDQIGTRYNTIKQLPITTIEQSNLHAAVSPSVHNARVLDLACGTGYYSRLLLTWGAASVVGVDISPAMISAAEAETSPDIPKEKLNFEVGDATSLGVIDGGEFDLVTAVWLCPYASGEEELRGMFETVAGNLKEGGTFVGLANPAVKKGDMEKWKGFNDGVMEGREKAWGVEIRYGEALGNGGYAVRVTTRAREEGGEPVAFGAYHLPTEMYEDAAREAGMKGKLEWKEVRFLEEVREEAIAAVGEEYFRQFFEEFKPHFGVFVIQK